MLTIIFQILLKTLVRKLDRESVTTTCLQTRQKTFPAPLPEKVELVHSTRLLYAQKE